MKFVPLAIILLVQLTLQNGAVHCENVTDDDQSGTTAETDDKIQAPLNVSTTTTNESEITPPPTESPTTETTDLPYVSGNNETFDTYLSLFLKNNPNAVVVMSPGYPNPYPALYDYSSPPISVQGGTGIDVIIHDLDIDPFKDYLYFRAGHASETEEKGPIITGLFDSPKKFKIVHSTELFIRFVTTQRMKPKNRGFLLTYAPFGEIRTTVTTEATVPTIPTTKLQSFTIIMMVAAINQNIDTWQNFKEILSISANKYVAGNQSLSLETATPDDVTFLSVQNCPFTWPNFQNCVRIRFAIGLATISSSSTTSNDNESLIEDDNEYELSTENLENMWQKYGKLEFESRNIYEYSTPDNNYILLLWGSITIGILIIFLIVLFSIWKMEIFQDYRRMTYKADDQKIILSNQSEIDISMFPSPHQIVPTLFPSNEPISNSIPYDYETRPIVYTQDDFPKHRNGSRLEQTSSFTRKEQDKDTFTQGIIDFNEPKSIQNVFLPEDEISFTLPKSSLSPRVKKKMLLKGMSKNESNT